MKSGVTYAGGRTEKLGLAMGGLGTSTLEIGRDGSFQNIRVQNDWAGKLKPTPTGTFMSVYARTAVGRAAGRLLQLEAPQGLPCIRGLRYTGQFPFTRVLYKDDTLPCRVELEAFSPFVPLDEDSSSLPLVFFRFRLKNPSKRKMRAAAAISWCNDIAAETGERGLPAIGNLNTLVGGERPAILMTTRDEPMAGSEYLLAALPSDGVRVSAVADWWTGAPGRWMGPNFKQQQDLSLRLWRSFLNTGRLPGESGYDDGLGKASYHQPVAALSGEVDLKAGETRDITFALAWCFPGHYDRASNATKAKVFLGHQYATRFPGGTRDVLAWAAPRYEALRAGSRAWRKPIEDSSLPPKLKALTTEIVYLLPRISWWLADGRFVMYEAIGCTRVQATILDIYIAPVMAALFPELHARALRATAAAQLETGEIPSTLGRAGVHHHEYRVFSPGDVSVFPITVAWEMLWGGDPRFCADMYPALKKALQWGKANLDADNDGIPDCHGIDQGWDTFPMQGAAAYIADQWMAGLLAGERMARFFGDWEFAAWCRKTRRQASTTTEKLLWNGSYYDLYNNPATGDKSDICFADQFTYGELASAILELGHTHPPARIRKALASIWRLNVETCRFGARMGSLPDGSPADSSVHGKQKGGASQSNAFTPVSTGPLAALAIQNGMVDKGLALAEQMAETIIDFVEGPWSGELLFNSMTGECFYGIHYSDCLIVWDIMHALTGVPVNALEGVLKLAPPRVPVKAPVFGRLYCGQVDFAVSGRRVTLTLGSLSAKPTWIPTLTVHLPRKYPVRQAVIRAGKAETIEVGADGATNLKNVAIGPRGKLTVEWTVT